MTTTNLNINEEKCVKCGQCLKECIIGCLEFNDDTGIPQFAKEKESKCIGCQHCFAVCPTGALSICGANPEISEEISGINSDELFNLIKSRRSIRRYKPVNLDQQRLDKLKEMLKYTPTGVNFHKLHFAFVDDIEVMDKIRDKANSRLIDFLANPLVKKFAPHIASLRNAIIDGNDVVFRGAPHMVIVSVPTNAHCKKEDPLIALSYFDLYAQSMGVGTLWCGFAYYCFKLFPELCEYIEVPDNYRVAYAMLFGIPDVKYSRQTQPKEHNITSVKGNSENITLLKRIKRLIWNI